MNNYRSLQKQARKAKQDAENTAARDNIDWYRAQQAEIAATADLTDEEQAVASRLLLLEFGRRANRSISKAKRDNSVMKLLERQVHAEIEAEREERDG